MVWPTKDRLAACGTPDSWLLLKLKQPGIWDDLRRRGNTEDELATVNLDTRSSRLQKPLSSFDNIQRLRWVWIQNKSNHFQMLVHNPSWLFAEAQTKRNDLFQVDSADATDVSAV